MVIDWIGVITLSITYYDTVASIYAILNYLHIAILDNFPIFSGGRGIVIVTLSIELLSKNFSPEIIMVGGIK